MPTVIGIAFVSLALYCFFQRPSWLFGVLIVASLFEASSAFNGGGRGVQPYYVVALLVVLRAFLDRKRRFDGAPSFNGRSALLVFALIGVGSALVLPVVFAGVPVYSPSLGLEEGFALRPPLSLSQSNFAQAAYLLLQVLVVWAAAALSPFSRSTRKFYVFTFYLLVSVIFLQLSCRGLGLQFPYKMLQNNPGYYMEDISTDLRPPGTFAEPSMAGLALTMFLVGFLSEYLAGEGSRWRVLVALAAVGVVSSSSSVIATVIVGAAMFVVSGKNGIGSSRPRHQLSKILFIVIVAVALGLSPLKDTLISQTVGKGDTDSFAKRLTADVYALDLAASTHWIGVGLGSNRPSSLLASLLSNLGALGSACFFILFILLLSNAKGNARWVRWSAAAVIADMIIGVPDITTVSLWVVMALAVHFQPCSGLLPPQAPACQGAEI